MSGADGSRWAGLRDAAIEVLRANDRGTFTQPAAGLYPHQWSWDSAITAVGWAHVDPARAVLELDGILAAQWSDGRLPHLVFHPEEEDAESYRPGPEFWDAGRSPAAPHAIRTSGIAAPPVHAAAVLRVREIAGEAIDGFVVRSFPRLMSWHRYLVATRDPDGSGLIAIHHPWESWDNLPTWDPVLERVEIGALAPHARRDIGLVADPTQRPSEAHYGAFRWLVDLLKGQAYDDAEIRATHPFVVADVAVSALLLASNEALRELAPIAGGTDAERATIDGWTASGHRGLEESLDASLGICVSRDLRHGTPIRARTAAGLAPLFAASLADRVQAPLLAEFASERFMGHPALRWPLPPTTSPLDPAFEPRNYWRGPVWPVVNWLFWIGLRRSGHRDLAERLRVAALDQVDQAGFAEYFDPFSGAALGARAQSWTAAAVIDWMGPDAQAPRS